MPNTQNEIVFVCTANTCRSPMAEALFRHALNGQPDPLKSLKVNSAGVSGFPGQPPSPNTVRALNKVGIDLKDHSSKTISQEMVDNALAFFCMTETHLAMLSYQIDPPPNNIFLMRQFMPEGEDSTIPDPFGGSIEQYEACRDSMVEAIPSLLNFVKELVAARDNPHD